jgi:MoxR-like ATPase
MAEILKADEFQVTRDRLEEFAQLLGAQLDDLFSWLGVSEAAVNVWSRTFMHLVLLVSLCAAAAVLVRALMRRLEHRRRRPPARAHALQAVRRLDSPRSHARDAARALAAGRLRDAIHHAYLMSLSALERRRLVMVDRTRTNWEYHAQVVSAGAAGPARRLAELNAVYDRKWYGHEPIAEDEARRFDRLARDLVREVGDETV